MQIKEEKAEFDVEDKTACGEEDKKDFEERQKMIEVIYA